MYSVFQRAVSLHFRSSSGSYGCDSRDLTFSNFEKFSTKGGMLSATSFHCLVLHYCSPRPLKVAGSHRSVRVEEEIGFEPAVHTALFTQSFRPHDRNCSLLSNRYPLTGRESYPLGRGPAGLRPALGAGLAARAESPSVSNGEILLSFLHITMGKDCNHS